MEQNLFGIFGIVTCNAKPVKAKITVDNFDKYNSWVYSDATCGDFTRVIAANTYSLTITYNTYTIKVPNVVVTANKRTDLGTIEMTGTSIQQNSLALARNGLKIVAEKGSLQFINESSSLSWFTIFSLTGSGIGSFSVNQGASLTVKAKDFPKPLTSGVYLVAAKNKNGVLKQQIVIR
jgi:hypothetical protein